jgi:hypothetical protein
MGKIRVMSDDISDIGVPRYPSGHPSMAGLPSHELRHAD